MNVNPASRPNSVQPHHIPLPPSHTSTLLSSNASRDNVHHALVSSHPVSVNSVPLFQHCPPSVPPRRNTVSAVPILPLHAQPIEQQIPLASPFPYQQQPFVTPPASIPPLIHPQPFIPFQPPPSVLPVLHSNVAPDHLVLPAPFAHPSQITVTDSKSALPSLTSIPTLRSAVDWPAWEAAVFRLVDAMGLRGYLCRIPQVGDLVDPTSRIVLPLQYDFDSPPHVADEFRTFWVHNDIVEHILVGKLTIDIASTLPLKRTGQFMLPTHTARDTLAFLRKRYSVGSVATADMLKDGVVNLSCAPGNVIKYIESWRNVVHQLVGSPWDLSDYQKTQKFVDGLLNHLGWAVLKDRMHQFWLRNNTLDHNVFTFDSLATEVLDIHYKWKSLQRKPASIPPSSSKSPPSDATPDKTDSSTPRSSLKCSNCGGTGHTGDRCWQKGGPLEHTHNKLRVNVASELLDESCALAPVDETTECVPDVIESDANEIFVSAYDSLDSLAGCEEPPFAAFVRTALPSTVAFFSTKYNSILDSGCTTHLFKDRDVFWFYDESGAVDVGTANCGTLSTCARGKVRFRAHVDAKHVIFVLKDCLHAPEVPINLLSVGSMVENHLHLVFESASTSITFPG
ncbi:hypothetical protein H0H92_007401 [Tricholoma furcatifolium]|nr:hypothetical protein H0H92_007401 [Tricholoma furcatifolium]